MKVIKWLDEHLEHVIMSVLLAAIAIMLFGQIVLRVFTKNTLSWPEEVSQYCYVYIAFFGISLCIKERRMLKVDILVEKLPRSISRWLTYFGELFSLAVWGLLWYGSYFVLIDYMQQPRLSQTIGYNLVVVYGMPFFALGLAVIRSIQSVFKSTKKLVAELKNKEEVK
ncbi:MAG: TRAP transporter small permease [Lachnospiraceae bacterium]|nr:TRAP transporter small permease [Candidatus Minthocola equi]